MTDYTIDDLVGERDAATADDEPDDAGGGEWVGELIDKLDERGYLDAIIAKQFDLDGPGGAPQPATDGGTPDGEAPDLGADEIAHFGKLVIDSVGDVPVSTIVQHAENNPETVDALVAKALGNDDGEL